VIEAKGEAPAGPQQVTISSGRTVNCCNGWTTQTPITASLHPATGSNEGWWIGSQRLPGTGCGLRIFLDSQTTSGLVVEDA